MDLKDLEPYIVVPLTGEKVSDHDAAALRIMDGEVEPGVKALWDDEGDTLVAFLFAGAYTKEKAQQWVKEAEEKGINLGMGEPEPQPDSRNALVNLLQVALSLLKGPLPMALVEGRWFAQGAKGFPLAPEERPWSWNATKGNAILDAGGWTMYASAHLVVDMDAKEEGQRWPEVQKAYKLPVAELINGRLHYVWNGVRAANGALHGARTPMKIPQAAKDAALRTVKKLYGKFDKDFTASAMTALHIFPVSLETQRPDGLDADLIWKEILSTSTTYRPQTGDEVTITQDIVDSVEEAFMAGVLENVAISADDHHYESGGIVPAEKTVGFVQAVKKVGGRLWAGLKLLDEEIRSKLEAGLIQDASVFIHPDFHDRRDGKEWPWVLVHLLLTNYPQLVGLAPFGEQPVDASLDFGGAERIIYTKVQEANMPNDTITLTAEQAQRWEAFEALGLPPEQVAEFQGLGLSVDEIKQAVGEREATRTKARDLEVQAILLALQGQGEHDGVVQVKGTRHWPVVCEAVEKALKEQPQAMALDIGDGGTTSLDEVVLALVNAIPEEGRMSLTAQPTGDREPVEDEPATDEQIDELDDRLR